MRCCKYLTLLVLILPVYVLAQPTIHFTRVVINAGNIPETENTRFYRWDFKNISNTPVTVNVEDNGGYFFAYSHLNRPILPGEISYIEGALGTKGHTGDVFTKTALVTTDKGDKIQITLKGTIVPFLEKPGNTPVTTPAPPIKK